ncbi:diaminobutyrate acetyltransferase [Embleya sp. NBC_00896]|uniref:diaminobutyrate acetyltransferase n=1 Tax=Embleya sp. NBC_00896 TaxID=2975961 RepID=UPI002F918B9A|nr:diaminobutyrate acetyltransferase [Embleya sp. NBC_00896]
MSTETNRRESVVTLDAPTVRDGAALWRLARDSRTLDLNSSYSYLLWCRDFAATSVVARDEDGEALGFVTGYVRPDLPDTLMVWQVAVAEPARGRGLAKLMLAELVRRRQPHGQVYVETTITSDNIASIALFTALGRDHGAGVGRTELFGTPLFPDRHAEEVLYRIGPFGPFGPFDA